VQQAEYNNLRPNAFTDLLVMAATAGEKDEREDYT
jgi:hypothetical protein